MTLVREIAANVSIVMVSRRAGGCNEYVLQSMTHISSNDGIVV